MMPRSTSTTALTRSPKPAAAISASSRRVTRVFGPTIFIAHTPGRAGLAVGRQPLRVPRGSVERGLESTESAESLGWRLLSTLSLLSSRSPYSLHMGDHRVAELARLEELGGRPFGFHQAVEVVGDGAGADGSVHAFDDEVG